jgi:hypothetical protein
MHHFCNLTSGFLFVDQQKKSMPLKHFQDHPKDNQGGTDPSVTAATFLCFNAHALA